MSTSPPLAHLQAASAALLYPRHGAWLQALTWWHYAATLAPALPLPLAADLGMLCTGQQPDLSDGHDGTDNTPEHDYRAFLRAAAVTPAVRSVATGGMRDVVVAALLAHLAHDAPIPHPYRLPPDTTPAQAAAALDAALRQGADVTALQGENVQEELPPFATAPLLEHLLTRLRRLTPADVRFVQMVGPHTLSAIDMADLRALTELLTLPPLDHPLLDEVLAFLPALAETPTGSASQTYAVDGISGLARRGSLDMVVPTEWALPDELLAYRFLNGELLYYGRESPPENKTTLFVLLLQGGDAMAGDTDLLARACALALARAAAARGAAVQCCWFDRVLHPPQGLLRPREVAALIKHHASGGVDLPRVLAAVQAHVRAHAASYARIEVQWLLHTHSGSDQVEPLRHLAHWLRTHVGCSALFLCAGATPATSPPLADVLAPRWSALGSAALHDAEERAAAARALRGLAQGSEREALPEETAAPLRREIAAHTKPPAHRRIAGARQEQVLEGGHSGEILCVTWSPDSKFIASSSHDRTICLWRVEDGTLLRTLSGHSRKVLSVAWSPDGEMLASASDDRSVRLWRVSDGTLLHTLSGHTREVRDVAWTLDGLTLASAADDDSVRLWRVSDGTLLHRLRGHTLEVNSVSWAPDGLTLATASRDATVRLWRVWDGAPLQTLEGHGDWVRCVAWAPDGQVLASVADDRTVRLWRGWDGALLRTLRGHRDRIWSVAWSPDGRLLATSSGSADRSIRLWWVENGTLLQVLQGHTRCIYRVAWSPDGQMLASASLDKTIRLWRVEHTTHKR